MMRSTAHRWSSRLCHYRPTLNPQSSKNLAATCGIFLVAMGLPLASIVGAACADEFVSTSRELPRIAAGTRISEDQAGHWNRIVLLSRPIISSGDVDALPEVVRESVSDFVLTIMAAIEQTKAPGASQARYQLTDIGVGYSTLVENELRAVTVAEAANVGVNLGLFTRMTLVENERQLSTAKVIASTSTLMIIDVPVFVLRGAEHREYVMRHFIWVDPLTGRSAALVWLVKQDLTGNNVVEADEPPRWAHAGLSEDRAIHVDGSQFNMFGIPNRKAFAIEQLPPGRPVAWTEEARQVAALDDYDVESLRALSAALNNMLLPAKPE